MQRVIIGALSALAYRERRDLCRETWFPDAKEAGMTPVFLVGRGPGCKDTEDVLRLPCPDRYICLPQKTRQFCIWALQQSSDWDWLFKCDDDTMVSIPRLQEAANWFQGYDYVGSRWKPAGRCCSGGAGYFMSRRVVKLVAEHMTQSLGKEDVQVGRLMERFEIPLIHDPRFIPRAKPNIRPWRDNTYITAHYLDRESWIDSHKQTGLHAND